MNSLDRLLTVLSIMQFDPWLAIQGDRALLEQGTFQPHLSRVAANFSAICFVQVMDVTVQTLCSLRAGTTPAA
jgi:hypothetical protein